MSNNYHNPSETSSFYRVWVVHGSQSSVSLLAYLFVRAVATRIHQVLYCNANQTSAFKPLVLSLFSFVMYLWQKQYFENILHHFASFRAKSHGWSINSMANGLGGRLQMASVRTAAGFFLNRNGHRNETKSAAESYSKTWDDSVRC